jgi:hypothetical protein
MKRLVTVTPEQYASAEAKQKAEQQASGKRKPGPKKNGSGEWTPEPLPVPSPCLAPPTTGEGTDARRGPGRAGYQVISMATVTAKPPASWLLWTTSWMVCPLRWLRISAKLSIATSTISRLSALA